MSSGVRYEVRERIAVITLDRAPVRNALGPEEWQALAALVARAASDSSVSVLLLAGEGGNFSAGGDLQTMPERLALGPQERRAQLVRDAQAIRALVEFPRPVLAAIDGACMGAGLSLALACDLRIASTRSRFGAVFHRVGLTGDFGLFHLLPRAVGLSRATELVMLAESIDAARAEAFGLVQRLVPAEELERESLALAARISDGPPVAQRYSKMGLRRTFELDLAAMIDWEAEAQAVCSRTADVHEGLSAWAEKRAPRFRGQ